jgi:hypothetical protein
MVKQMLTWNSPLSTGFDFIFGFLPALALGAMCLAGLYFLFLLPPSEDRISLDFVFFGVGGFLACCSMVLVTFQRQKTQLKWLHIAMLAIGVLLVGYYVKSSGIWASGVGYKNVFYSFSPFISIALIAIKHIIMLTRA